MTGRTTGGLTTAQIKLLAAAVMVLDHLRRFFGGPLWLTLAGRAALPLFLFAGAEACAHTHSPARRLLRLQAAATATTALELALMAAVPSQVSLLPYRAFGALFCAAAYSRVWDLLVQAVQTRRVRPALAAVGLACLPLTGVLAGWLAGALDPGPARQALQIAARLLPNLALAEGGPAFVVLGVGFYLLRGTRAGQAALLLAFSAALLTQGEAVQAAMAWAALPICLYNGRPGPALRRGFYLFYPAHLAAFYLLAAFLE